MILPPEPTRRRRTIPRWVKSPITLSAAGALVVGSALGGTSSQNERTELTDSVTSLTAQVVQLTSERDDAKRALETSESARDDLAASVSDLEAEVSTGASTVSDLQGQLTAAVSRAETAEARADSAESQARNAASAPSVAGFADVGTSSSSQSTYYANCTAVRAAGAAPIRSGEPGYSRKLDRDGDGVGCE